MLAKLSRRDRIALLIGAVATVLLLLSVYVVLPLLDRMAASPGSVQQKELDMRRDQRLLAQAEIEKTELAAAADHLKQLEAGLLESPSPSLANAEWQQLVGQVADSKGIVLGSSEFLRTQDLGAGYSLVTGRLQLRCRLDQLVDFMVALASSPKLLSVTHMAVTAAQGDPHGTLNVELTVGAATRTAKAVKDGTAQPE